MESEITMVTVDWYLFFLWNWAANSWQNWALCVKTKGKWLLEKQPRVSAVPSYMQGYE